MKNIKYSSIENVKSNICLFDNWLENLKAEEEKRRQSMLMNELMGGNLNELFNTVQETEETEENPIGEKSKVYFDLIQERFGN